MHFLLFPQHEGQYYCFRDLNLNFYYTGNGKEAVLLRDFHSFTNLLITVLEPLSNSFKPGKKTLNRLHFTFTNLICISRFIHEVRRVDPSVLAFSLSSHM
jgi:hypothetical protein